MKPKTYDEKVCDYIYRMRNQFSRIEGYWGRNYKIQWTVFARPFHEEEFEETDYDLLTAVKKLYLSLKRRNLHDE